MSDRIAVLGAGIQGTCAALELARKGHRVLLIDRAVDMMTRASGKGEGKIHLGFVYANDESMRTPKLMLRAALAFAPILEQSTGPIDWPSMCGRPFTYAIARDSMVPTSRLLEAYERLQSAYLEQLNEPQANYLGTRPERLWREGAAAPRRFYGSDVVASVDTVELAVEPSRLRAFLTKVVASTPNIEPLFAHDVRELSRTPGGFRVGGVNRAGSRWTRDVSMVVNCLWEERLLVDQMLDVVPERPWVYRLKYRMLGALPAALDGLASTTVVLGPFGDLVVFPGQQLYVSWYPTCMRGWSQAVAPPRDWDVAHESRIDRPEDADIVREAVLGFSRIAPALDTVRFTEVSAGIIFSWGKTDIDDPESALHKRDEIGVSSHDGYLSVNTGKLTCAPLFARDVAKVVEGT